MSIALICTVIDSFTPTRSGSIGIITWELCQAARRAGVEPLVIARRHDADPYPWPKLHLVDWPRVPAGRVGSYLMRAQRKLSGWQHFRQGAFMRRLLGVLKACGADKMPMLLQNDPEAAVYLREELPRASIIHHFQNQQECRPQFRRRFKFAANVVTAVSNFTARWIEQYYDLEKNSVRTVYNGVDTERFHPAKEPPAGNPVISFLGRTGIEKAPDVVLKAALRVARKTRGFGVQILGANHTGWVEMDAYQRELRTLSSELESLGVPVRWSGFLVRSVVPDEIRRGHIHVTPSRWDEPFGMVTLENMSCGLATVASRTGGTPEFVGDGGLLFERDSIEGLAEHLERLVCDESFRRDYARRGRAQAEAFTWDRAWRDFACLAGS